MASAARDVTPTAEDREVAALRSTEADFKNLPGYWKRPAAVRRADGTINPDGYEWGVRWKPAAGDGKMSKVSEAVLERIRPHAKAADALSRKRQLAEPKATLYDARGQAQYVSPAVAAGTMRANGWSDTRGLGLSRTRHEGRGPTGMLFVYRGGWVATGRWCYTRPRFQADRPAGGRRDGSMNRKGVHFDPDGGVWRYLNGEWRRTA